MPERRGGGTQTGSYKRVMGSIVDDSIVAVHGARWVLDLPERGQGREKEMEKNIDVRETFISRLLQAPNPVMCPGWELNRRPFCLR